MDFKSAQDQLKNLSQQLNSVVEMQNKFYAGLDPEIYEKVKQHHNDMNKIMSEFRKGNNVALNELINKYTSK